MIKRRVYTSRKATGQFNDEPEGGGVSASLKHTAHNQANNKTQAAKLSKQNVHFANLTTCKFTTEFYKALHVVAYRLVVKLCHYRD